MVLAKRGRLGGARRRWDPGRMPFVTTRRCPKTGLKLTQTFVNDRRCPDTEIEHLRRSDRFCRHQSSKTVYGSSHTRRQRRVVGSSPTGGATTPRLTCTHRTDGVFRMWI